DVVRERISGTRGGEDRARIVRRGECGISISLRELGRHRGQRVRTRVDGVHEAGGDQIELSGRAVPAAMELAAQDEAGAEPGPDGEEAEVLPATRDPEPVLSERCEIDVVLDTDLS